MVFDGLCALNDYGPQIRIARLSPVRVDFAVHALLHAQHAADLVIRKHGVYGFGVAQDYLVTTAWSFACLARALSISLRLLSMSW